MSAHHFFAPRVDGDVVTLAGEEGRHASRVLRIRVGEVITIGDGAGTVVTARTDSVEPNVRATVLERTHDARPTPELTVYPAVPKSGKLDLVVQKLTELGVDRIAPWFAERTIVRWDGAKSRAQGERLRAIAHDAAKQSKRAWLPVVLDPAALEVPPRGAFVLHEAGSSRMRDVLPDAPTSVALVVGPEGGLTDTEVTRFREAGAVLASLGAQILRAETASIVAATLVLHRYERIG